MKHLGVCCIYRYVIVGTTLKISRLTLLYSVYAEQLIPAQNQDFEILHMLRYVSPAYFPYSPNTAPNYISWCCLPFIKRRPLFVVMFLKYTIGKLGFVFLWCFFFLLQIGSIKHG